MVVGYGIYGGIWYSGGVTGSDMGSVRNTRVFGRLKVCTRVCIEMREFVMLFEY